jgi:hypothetical protein
LGGQSASKSEILYSELLTTAEAEVIFEPGVLGTPAPQPPGWDLIGAAAVCSSETLLPKGITAFSFGGKLA